MKKPAPKSASQAEPESLTPEAARAEHERLAAELEKHNFAYYQEDAPLISDAEYDALRRRYEQIELAFPNLAKSWPTLEKKSITHSHESQMNCHETKKLIYCPILFDRYPRAEKDDFLNYSIPFRRPK